MNVINMKQIFWNGFSASIPGSGHIRYGIPCQDASAVILSPRPALIVCDGRGSASHSHFGANAATKVFKSQIAVFEPMLASILDTENVDPDRWITFSRIIYRTLVQAKLDLVEEYGADIAEKDFDFTVACAVIGTRHIGCFQVGDGAIVLRQDGECLTAFQPDKGNFANETKFLHENGEKFGDFQSKLFDASVNSGIAITSDGPEYLMFQLPEMIPGPIFGKMLDFLQTGELCHQDIMNYLTRNIWNNDPRGADDRSLAILAPVEKHSADEQNDTSTDSSVFAPVQNEKTAKETVMGLKNVTHNTPESVLTAQLVQEKKYETGGNKIGFFTTAVIFFFAGLVAASAVFHVFMQCKSINMPQKNMPEESSVFSTKNADVEPGETSGKKTEPEHIRNESLKPEKQDLFEKEPDIPQANVMLEK